MGGNLSNVKVSDLLAAKEDFKTQLLLAVTMAVFVKIFFNFSVVHLRRIVDSKPWKEQFLRLTKRTYKSIGVDYGSDEIWYEAALVQFPLVLHHLIGGLLCVPAVFGITGISEETAYALARHGALFETAFELQDIGTRVYQYFYDKDFDKKNPPMVVRMLIMHHSCGLCTVIPMNMYFGSSVLFHEAVFLLQGAAGISIGASVYCYMLDLSKNEDIFRFKIMSVVALITIVYTRVVRYCTLGFETSYMLYSENFLVFLIYTAGGFLMSGFNIVLLKDSIKKFKKAIKMNYVSPEKIAKME
eukprot:CAMPEP_0184017912 /NCGR_PEP_ID=MMETSP0954-20121128/7824_1 /TAXON_ID=627963 /ORGANISM="Aplanochytrium sp, Strain PBS07" /LENGTH=299 /DNA_ID=CAMNT_0026299249 /DNA_START=287 /DNA_END=1186 /DNA_ORIENTATION=+